jgi:NADPH:quinone reductase-like Zn-dependent oxidoreductase
MRAFAVRSFGASPAILDLPVPATDGAIVVRVSYAGVNPLDYKLIEQLGPTSSYPFVVGVDFAGVVERVPSAESDLHAGDRVFGTARTHGTYAEYTAVALGATSGPFARTPDGVSDEQAAALSTSGLTALGSLELLGVSAGQRLVVMGATGGVGGYALQIALARGAHVVATVRGDADEARRLGADEVYDSNAVDVVDAIRAAHPGGVDAILDLVNGGSVFGRDAELLKPGGSIVSTIHGADVDFFAERHITAHNITPGSNPASSPQGLTELARLLVDGAIAARIGSTVGLDGAGGTLDKLRSGELHGKAVIRL